MHTERWYFLPKTIVKKNVLLVRSSCDLLGSIELCDSIDGRAFCRSIWSTEISSTVVLVMDVSISASSTVVLVMDVSSVR